MYARPVKVNLEIKYSSISFREDEVYQFEGYRQSCSGNKDFFALIARAALAIRAEKMYCQSRNRLLVMCMRVRLAICLANTCRHSNCFRYT